MLMRLLYCGIDKQTICTNSAQLCLLIGERQTSKRALECNVEEYNTIRNQLQEGIGEHLYAIYVHWRFFAVFLWIKRQKKNKNNKCCNFLIIYNGKIFKSVIS